MRWVLIKWVYKRIYEGFLHGSFTWGVYMKGLYEGFIWEV